MVQRTRIRTRARSGRRPRPNRTRPAPIAVSSPDWVSATVAGAPQVRRVADRSFAAMRTYAILALALGLAGCSGIGVVLHGAGRAGPALRVRSNAALRNLRVERRRSDEALRARNVVDLAARQAVNAVHDGFDASDIARSVHAARTAPMNAMIAEAARHGVRVELLLGDPSWIEPRATRVRRNPARTARRSICRARSGSRAEPIRAAWRRRRRWPS